MTLEEPSFEAILRPARPNLARAQRAIEGISDPREAWEVCATSGLVPDEWFTRDDGTYIFFGPSLERRQGFYPLSLSMVIALASDAANARAAEEIVRAQLAKARRRWRPRWEFVPVGRLDAERKSIRAQLERGDCDSPVELIGLGYALSTMSPNEPTLSVPEVV